jgi:hypothetical protein
MEPAEQNSCRLPPAPVSSMLIMQNMLGGRGDTLNERDLVPSDGSRQRVACFRTATVCRHLQGSFLGVRGSVACGIAFQVD